jgi:hypothetical protein
MLSKVKSSRETEKLRARLPAQLAPFASNISIIKPMQIVRIPRISGLHGCSCGVRERKIWMSVTVVPSSNSQSQDSVPHAKSLKLVWLDFGTTSTYLTGSVDSNMHSISLRYGPSKATAFTGWYDDPGRSLTESSHGNIKSVVEEVVRDMGLRQCELDDKLEVIEALLGDDGKQLLESHAEPMQTLRKTIEDELEVDDDSRDDDTNC